MALVQRFRPDDVFLSTTPLHHAATGTRVASMLADGHTHVVMNRFEPADFLRLVGEHRVSIVVLVPTQLRQILEAYQTENEYGRTIEAYRGTLNLEGRETTVDFLRFGRIALVYQSLDESQRGVWNQETRSWQLILPPCRTLWRAWCRSW